VVAGRRLASGKTPRLQICGATDPGLGFALALRTWGFGYGVGMAMGLASIGAVIGGRGLRVLGSMDAGH
jgi:hypothetical protein